MGTRTDRDVSEKMKVLFFLAGIEQRFLLCLARRLVAMSITPSRLPRGKQMG
jgi:hypothetical protein